MFNGRSSPVSERVVSDRVVSDTDYNLRNHETDLGTSMAKD